MKILLAATLSLVGTAIAYGSCTGTYDCPLDGTTCYQDYSATKYINGVQINVYYHDYYEKGEKKHHRWQVRCD